jgi:hypothetical protein
MKSVINSLQQRPLYSGQLLFLTGIGICLIIDPSYLLQVDQGGVSNYGTQLDTLIPYFAGISAAAVTTLMAARRRYLDDNFAGYLRYLGWIYAVSAVTTLPYQLNETLRLIHELSTVALFLYGTAGAVWLFTRLDRSASLWGAVSLLMLGFTITLDNYFGGVTLLLLGELFSLVGFAWLLSVAEHQLSSQ